MNLPNPRTLDRRVDFSGMTPIAAMATLAAKGALDKAGLRIRRDNCESVGLGGFDMPRLVGNRAHGGRCFSSPDNRGDIACFSNITPNSTAGWVSKALEIKGANITLTSGPNSGLQTLGHAARLVRENAAKSVLAIAADELYKREIDAYEKFGKIHRGAIEENFRLSFSTPSCGVLGEGAAAALVEDAETAKARGAKILGEILAFAAASDACAFGSHNLDGDGLLRAAREALDAAKIRAEEIDLVLWSPRRLRARLRRGVRPRHTLPRRPDACKLAQHGIPRNGVRARNARVRARSLGGRQTALETAHRRKTFRRGKTARQPEKNNVHCVERMGQQLRVARGARGNFNPPRRAKNPPLDCGANPPNNPHRNFPDNAPHKFRAKHARRQNQPRQSAPPV